MIIFVKFWKIFDPGKLFHINYYHENLFSFSTNWVSGNSETQKRNILFLNPEFVNNELIWFKKRISERRNDALMK